MNELALFAGAGGGILAGQLLGWRTVCAVERDAYAASVLAQRQNDGLLEVFPIWSGITTFDGKPWKGIIDVVSGGFPCQNISNAGKCEGIEGEKSGLWKEMARVVREVRPPYVFVENVAALTARGLGVVLGDLAALGYDAQWGVLGARDAGAYHIRERLWICAYARRMRHRVTPVCDQNQRRTRSNPAAPGLVRVSYRGWDTQPRMGRVADGVPFRVDRIKALGNAQVPIVAAAAWQQLNRLTPKSHRMY